MRPRRPALLSGPRQLLAPLLAMMVLGACPSPSARYNHKREPDPRKSAFVLGASDQLLITVWRNENLTTNATIRPDGTITMPLIGDLKAAGRTTQELQAEIKARLKTYVVDATVTVAVTQVNSYRFTVAGQVARPGLFRARSYMTVAEAIAMAGGPTRFASPGSTLIVRAGDKDGKVRRIPINYAAIAAGRLPEQNIVVLPGDTIYMP